MSGRQKPASIHALSGRIGAHRLHATHDPRDTTAAARRAFLDRFEAEVDPDHILSSDERARRAAHARSAYFAQLAYRSASRRRRRSAGSSPADADQ